MNIFWGMMKLWIFFGGSSLIWTILGGSFLYILGLFHKDLVQNWKILGGC